MKCTSTSIFERFTVFQTLEHETISNNSQSIVVRFGFIIAEMYNYLDNSNVNIIKTLFNMKIVNRKSGHTHLFACVQYIECFP